MGVVPTINASVIMKEIGLKFSFCLESLCGFSIMVDDALSVFIL